MTQRRPLLKPLSISEPRYKLVERYEDLQPGKNKFMVDLLIAYTEANGAGSTDQIYRWAQDNNCIPAWMRVDKVTNPNARLNSCYGRAFNGSGTMPFIKRRRDPELKRFVYWYDESIGGKRTIELSDLAGDSG